MFIFLFFFLVQTKRTEIQVWMHPKSRRLSNLHVDQKVRRFLNHTFAGDSYIAPQSLLGDTSYGHLSFGWKCVSCAMHQAGHMHVRMTCSCLNAIAPWCSETLYHQGVAMGQVVRMNAVTTDVLSTGWGALSQKK